MPAAREEIERAKEEGVRIINGRGLSKIIEQGGKVKGLETKKCVSVFDEKGHFSPVYDEGDKTVSYTHLPCAGSKRSIIRMARSR